MEEKKKVLVIMSQLGGAGAEKACIDFLRNFDYKRFEVTLLLIYDEGVYLRDVPESVRLISLYRHSPSKWKEKIFKRLPELRKYRIAKKLKDKLTTEKFDVIISFCEGLPVVAHSLIKDKSPLNLSWVHCDLINYPWTRRYFRKPEDESHIYERMNHIVLVSSEAKDSFEKKYCITKNLEVFPNIIDRNQILQKADEFSVDKRKFTIINIGRLVPVKNHSRLLDMMEILKSKGIDTELWIVGEGPLLTKLKDIVKNKGLDSNVRFLGFQKNPYPYLKASDLYVMSSDSEGYSLTISEALCLGKPIVSTPTARIKELEHSGGVEIADFTAVSLAEKTESFIRNSEKLKIFSQKSEEYGRLFNPENVMKRIYHLFI